MDELGSELVILWVLTGASAILMVWRLIMRWNRVRRFELGDYFTMGAVFTILLRSGAETVPLIWGTNQNSASDIAKFNSEEIYQHQIGAQLTFVNRVFYTVYIWLQKCVVMCIVQQLLRGVQSYWVLKLFWATMGATFIASLIVCFTECQPFNLYWQVTPYPGTCAAGNMQLLVFSVLEMTTDVMLMILPLRYLSRLQQPWLPKLRLLVLFMVGISIVGVTLTRLLLNQLHYHRTGPSHNIANVEIFFAAFVANAPPLYGLLNMKYGSSQRSRSKNISGSGNISGQQLDTLSSVARTKRERDQFGEWSSVTVLKKGEGDSDEELMIQAPPNRAESSTSITLGPGRAL